MTHLMHITPIPMLDQVLTNADRHHLVIADYILSSREYRNFYYDRVARGNFVILDCAAFELQDNLPTKTTLFERQIQAAAILSPTEIVIPDDMLSAKNTIWMAQEFVALAERSLPYRPQLLAVPHGKTLTEYYQCAATLAALPGVTTLGVQEEVEELYGVPRHVVAQVLKRFWRKEIHYNGVREDCQDLITRDQAKLVRSCDTAKFVVWGLNGYSCTPDSIPEYPGRASVGGRSGYFHYQSPFPERIPIIRKTIDAWDKHLDRNRREELV